MLTEDNCPPLSQAVLRSTKPSLLETLAGSITLSCLLSLLFLAVSVFLFHFAGCFCVFVLFPAGAVVQKYLWTVRNRPIKKIISNQLESRPSNTIEAFGPDPIYQEVAQKLCHITQKAIGWPNARFLPWDPLEAVLFYDAKTQNGMQVIPPIENHFLFEIYPKEFATLLPGTFGEFVDFVYQRKEP